MEPIGELINNGRELELLVASFFQAYQYYVDSNSKWIEDNIDSTGSVDILEIDVLAKTFSVSGVKSTLIECKRGCVFNDIFKFVGVAALIRADNNLLVCQSKNIESIKKTGDKINIKVITPEELISLLCKPQEEKFKLFYNANVKSSMMLDKTKIRSILAREFSAAERIVYNKIRSYMAELIGKIWKEPDVIEQAIRIKKLLDNHKDFVRVIARDLQLRPGNKNSEVYMNDNILCQAAGLLVLKVRVSYIICAIQCAIILENKSVLALERIKDQSFINVVNLLRKNLSTASKIPQFIQEFIYIFGGIVSLIRDEDLKNISKYMGIDVDEVKNILCLLEKLFEIVENRIQWGFVDDMNIKMLKYVPGPLKGLGILNRRKLGYGTEAFCFADEWIVAINNLEEEKK